MNTPYIHRPELHNDEVASKQGTTRTLGQLQNLGAYPKTMSFLNV
jgi:hypothetical protein